MNADEFWQWFLAEEARLRQANGQIVADAIEDRLRAIDPRVGVEVSDPGNERELVFTAWSQRDAFPVVHALMAAAPRALAGWKLMGLKPARGFAFAVDVDGVRVEAEKLRFDVLGSPQAPAALGIRVYVAGPAPVVDERWAQTLALLIETGIGEEAAAQIDYLEAAPGMPDPRSLPIDQLLPLVQWHRRKHAGS